MGKLVVSVSMGRLLNFSFSLLASRKRVSIRNRVSFTVVWSCNPSCRCESNLPSATPQYIHSYPIPVIAPLLFGVPPQNIIVFADGPCLSVDVNCSAVLGDALIGAR